MPNQQTNGMKTNRGPKPSLGADDVQYLPNTGRKGRIPIWPLEPDASEREMQVWRQLWRMPQAIMWEANRSQMEVALYTRRFVEAEKPNARVTLATLVKQMGDGLGLSSGGLRMLRWVIVDESGKKDKYNKTSNSTPSSPRNRLKAVQ